MTAPLQLTLFGSPQISYQGQPLTGFVSAKVRALLIYLAVTARPHSRDHLAHLLWEDTPASMKTNLRKALSNLRQLVGDLLVEEGKELIALDSQRCWVDVVAFDRLLKGGALTEAAQLYTSDFLAGFNPSLSYEFEAWALCEQSRLKSGMVDLLRKLAIQHTSTALSAGSPHNTLTEAIGSVRRLLDLEPWQEESHRWLMELLVKNGQRSAALAHFEVCKRVLQEELAIAPSAETLQLVAQIQQATLPVHKPAAKLPAIAQPEFPLIGRECEWQTIQTAWQHCLHNGPHFVCIAGEAGIGKTRLLEEARLWVVEQGYASVYARSYAAEGALAYSPVIDWLRSDVVRPTLAQLDEVWLNEITRLLPELLSTYPHLTSPKPIADGVQRRLFFEGLARAIIGSGEPLLLLIDDLQWCDRETLEWLRFLLRFDTSQSFLIVGAYRVEAVDRDHPLQLILQTLRLQDGVTEIELGRLSVSETDALVTAISVKQISNEQGAELWRATAGHPLFVIECFRNRNEHGSMKALPRKVQNVIRERLIQLSPDATYLVRIAATVGRQCSIELLARLCNQSRDSILNSVDELLQRKVFILLSPQVIDFSHDRIRDVTYQDINQVKRPFLHQLVAQTIEQIHVKQLDEVAGELAYHYQAAGETQQALAYFRQAANVARRFHAHAEVVSYLEKAITLIQSAPESIPFHSIEIDLWHELGLARILTTRWGSESVETCWRRANELAHRHGTLAQQARSLMTLDTVSRNRGEWRKALRYAEEALPLAEASGDQFLLYNLFGGYGGILYHLGEVQRALDILSQEGLSLDELPKPTFAWFSGSLPHSNLLRVAKCLWMLGFAEKALACSNEILAIGRRQASMTELFSVIFFTAMLHSFLRNLKTVQMLSEELIEISYRYDNSYYRLPAYIFQGWVLAHNHNPLEGARLIQDNFNTLKAGGNLMFAPQLVALLADALGLAGQYEKALDEIETILSYTEESGNVYWNADLLRMKGELLEQLGVVDSEVESWYQRAICTAVEQGAHTFELRATMSLARFWQSQGKQSEAYQLLAPIYNWFTEGFDTPDLVEAKQLLGELADHALNPV